jgi:hypothetical protein
MTQICKQCGEDRDLVVAWSKRKQCRNCKEMEVQLSLAAVKTIRGN